ncbi:MAG: methyl-accepting chemotaxis protein [Proteobacteria bacterium]|nr:methyl-accepting chemotaxis protein [Pseudomonadota bacterium]
MLGGNMSSSTTFDKHQGFFSIKRITLFAGIFLVLSVAGNSIFFYRQLVSNRIGSPAYFEITDAKDYVADIVPPPLLPMEAFARIQQMKIDPATDVEARVEKFNQLHQLFDERIKFWTEKFAAEGDVKGAEWSALRDKIKERGDKFWTTLQSDLIPAIRNNSPDQDRMLVKFTHDFIDALSTIDQDTQAFIRLSQVRQDEAVESSNGVLRMVIVLAILLCMIVVSLVLLAQRSVVKAVTGISGAMDKLAGGDLQAAIPYEQRRDEIGAMAKAVSIFKRQANENNENKTQSEMVIKSLGTGLRQLSSGNLTFRINEPFAPALDALRQHFNDAADALQETLSKVRLGTDGIKSGTEEIAHASDDLSRRTENQAANLEETAAAVAEITNKVKQTASGAVHARSVVGLAKDEADRSGEVVRRAVGAMQQIEQSSQRITQIIGVIDEIAFQTNLLALNAGVEAARAGEAGRGFAVVASEVRALAQRSADAAREIKQLLSTSQAAVEQGVGLVAETGTSLQAIISRVAEINSIVAEISASAEQQATGLQEVNTAVDQMDQVTQQNASMVEQTTAATRALTQQSGELAQLVARFTLAAARNLSASQTAARPVVEPAAKADVRPAAPAQDNATRFQPYVPAPKVRRTATAAAAAADDGWQEF